jgi:hypothetical protein
VVESAIAEIGTDAKGPADRAAMNAGNRERRERSTDDRLRLRDRGRDTIKGVWQRSEDQRCGDEKLLHESSSIVVPLIAPTRRNVNCGPDLFSLILLKLIYDGGTRRNVRFGAGAKIAATIVYFSLIGVALSA